MFCYVYYTCVYLLLIIYSKLQTKKRPAAGSANDGDAKKAKAHAASASDIKLWKEMATTGSLPLQILPVLKDISRSLGLAVGGAKGVLTERITDAVKNL